MEQHNLQTVLWWLADPWGWRIYAAACALMSVFLFRALLREAQQKKRIDTLMGARLIWLAAGIAGSLVRLNSACEFVSPFLFALAGTYMAFLIDSGWCYRLGTFWQRLVAVLGEWRHDLWPVPGERHSTSD